MRHGPDNATAGRRLAVAGMVAAALAVLSPSLFVNVLDLPVTVSLAVVTLVLATLVRLGERGAFPAVRVAGVRPSTGDVGPPVLAGRITDPTHHPLRPRAPGLA